MSRNLATATRSQLALQSYLDGLLQEAAAELEMSVSLDEFEAAVLEEQVRDARLVEPVVPASVVEPLVQMDVAPVELLAPIQAPLIDEAPPALAPDAELAPQPAALLADGRPAWAEEPFECLLFDVAGLTLAVPLICLGSIYPLEGQELTPLFGQPDWFLGILPSQAGNLKVLDTARWVMPERYRDDFREGLQYVISVQGYEWGWPCIRSAVRFAWAERGQVAQSAYPAALAGRHGDRAHVRAARRRGTGRADRQRRGETPEWRQTALRIGEPVPTGSYS